MGADHRSRAPRPLVRRRRRRDRSAARRRDGPALEPTTAASRGRVVAVEPHTRFAYRWAPFKDPGGEEPVEGNSTLVEFTLQPEGDATRLRVVESGFASLATSEAQRARNLAGNTEGWEFETGELREYAREGRRLMSAPADGVFAALADPTRWRVLSLLAERGEGTATSLAGELPVSRVAVVKHLAVLDRAGLVEGRREGREVRYTRPHRAARRDRPLDGRPRVAVGRPPGGDQADGRGGAPRSRATPRGGDRHEHAPDRVAAGVGGRAPAAAREGEGADPRPRRAGRRAPADAVAGGGARSTRSTGPSGRRACSTCSTAAAS